MTSVPFNAKVWKQGKNSLVITVPSYIYQGINKQIDLKIGDVANIIIKN